METQLSMESRVLEDDVLVVSVGGSLDALTTEEFDRAIQAHLDQGRTRIILDCSRLGYLSSAAIGSLVKLQARLRKRGGEVKLAGLYGAAADVIRLVRLDKLLHIYGDIEFARQSFAENGP
jgi:anti-sigma B factor antagonist